LGTGRNVAPRVALVTGGNRGLGLEVCRQLAEGGHVVVLGSRDRAKGEAAAREVPGDVHAIALDVADLEAPAAVVREVHRRFGRIDVLVNNAGVHYDTWQGVVDADWRIVREAFETNLFGAWRMAQAVAPLMRAAKWGRIVNVSSESGSLASMGAGTPAYATSKAALNALTRVLAAELRGSGVLVNAVCPGWVATDMGGPGGGPVENGAPGIVWAATLPNRGPTGGFFRDGKPLPW
jgi:NAD(P)-dependent dehydrogenase (short-subunit alcohol dehydrogenase family)